MSEIDDYIRANRDRYTREALTRKLAEAGHDPAAIEAAWGRADADAPAPEPPRGILGRLFLIAIIAGIYGYVGFLGIAGVSVLTSYGRPATGVSAILATVVMGAYGLLMLAAFLVSVRRIWRSVPVGRAGTTLGAALGASFLFLFGISGLCVVGTIAVGFVQSNVP